MIAIAALTYNGTKLALSISEKYKGINFFVTEKYHNEFSEKAEGKFSKISDFLKTNWKKFDAFILIMASGIVVRSIAPLIENKKNDPAILVIDEKGKNVISLLSGHLGGANELTLKISELIKANPVITTASDVNDLPAFDEIARKNNFTMINDASLVKIAASIIENKPIEFFSSIKIDVKLPSNILILKNLKWKNTEAQKVILSEKEIKGDIFQLIPKNIVIGIGCRKDTKSEKIFSAFNHAIKKAGIRKEAIKVVATVPLKANEKGILELVKNLETELKIIPFDEIKKIENKFEGSSFVKSITGVSAVAEPSSFIAAQEPEIILKKQALDGVTIAIVKDKSIGLTKI